MQVDISYTIVYDVIHMIRTQVLLTPTLHEALKTMAQAKGKSFSALVRDLLGKIVLKKKNTGGEILLEMAKHAFSDPNLPKDLATNDEYLYGKKAHYDNR